MAIDALGNLFISDDALVRKVDTNGIIGTAAGKLGAPPHSGDGGPATNAGVNFPGGVSLDALGNIFVADTDDNRIRKVDTNEVIWTVAGPGTRGTLGDGGQATNAYLDLPPRAVADQWGNLFIADNGNMRIRKVTNTQGPTLALNNATPENAGDYQVVVTGLGGSVTSSVAQLLVASAPIIYGTAPNSDGSMTLQCVSPPNSTNVVLCTASLVPSVAWQPLTTNMAGEDGSWQFTDTNAPAYQSRFYSFVVP